MRAILQGKTKMRKVKVKTNELLDKVRENRVKHKQDYKEAVEGYKETALREVNRGMEKLQKQIKELETGEMIGLAAVSFNLPLPEDHTKDYDQVIAMLEMSVDEELEIQSDEFACYVMDDWDWKNKFLTVSEGYKNRTF